MTPRFRLWRPALIACYLGWSAFVAAAFGDEQEPELDVPYEPTHPAVVDAMLSLAEVNETDVVYDLGCGDGRIVIAAAKKFKARGMGVDIDPQRLRESEENARLAQVTDRVRFRRANIMDIDLREASVVTLYLLDEVNLMLRPKLFAELRPGTRIVSHAFDMSDWASDQKKTHSKARNRVIHRWVIPAAVGGYWTWSEKTSDGVKKYVLRLKQQFQRVSGQLGGKGMKTRKVEKVSLEGGVLSFRVSMTEDGKLVERQFRGVVEGDKIIGTWEDSGGARPEIRRWMASRRKQTLSGEWRLTVSSTERRLNGRWQLWRDGSAVTAKYRLDGSKDDIDASAAYFWGSNFRLEWTVGDDLLVFTGSMNRDAGSGKLRCDTWDSSATWKAERTTRPSTGGSKARTP